MTYHDRASKEQASAILVKALKPRMIKNSAPHVIMLILKSFGVNNFVSKESLIQMTHHADSPRLFDVLKRSISKGYISRQGNSVALTPLGNHALYTLAELRPTSYLLLEKEGDDLFID